MSVYAGPEIVNDGLVLCLDAGNAKSYPGSGTTWTDLSGNGRNGTLTNGPTFDSGNGGVFNFNSVNSNYVSLPLADAFLTNKDIYTVSCWISYSNNTSTVIWSQTDGNGFGDTATLFELNLGTNGTIAYITGGGTSIRTILDSNQVIKSDVWYNITGTKNGLDFNLYINGIYENGVSNAFTSLVTNTAHNIGKPKTNERYFNGKFANGLIYNRALSTDEILQNFNALRGRYGI